MKAISIRGIDREVSDKLKKIAQKDGKSVNQYIVDMIKQNIGMQKEKKYTKTYDDLDHLFGRWSASEFKKIKKSIDSQRKIDMIEAWGLGQALSGSILTSIRYMAIIMSTRSN